LPRARAKRHKKRITCELRFSDGRKAGGIVADISRSGVFIQTSASAPPDSLVELRLMPSGGQEILVRARVARLKKVDQRLVQISAAGLGLEILDAPEAYYRELPPDEVDEAPRPAAAARPAAAGPQRPAAPAAPSRPSVPLRKWKVRVSQTSGPRSRVLDVEAASEADARKLALERLGPGWQAIDVSGPL
jgi:hypothetical protein